jgi:glycosyltransferase involved in cell wall biosynthesis
MKHEGGLRKTGCLKKFTIDKPLVSIITVVFNGKNHLEETIQSIVNQTYKNLEYIIIDGGSTDGTLDIIYQYDTKIDYWLSEKDGGIYDAMNKGIKQASGDWLLFIGADDCLFSGDVIASVSFLDFKNHLLISGCVIYDTGTKVCSRLGFSTLLHNTVHHQSSFYNSKLFLNWKYDTKFHVIADYELNLILYLTNARTVMIDKVISFCREGGVSRENYQLVYRETNEVRRIHLGKKSLLFQVLYFIKYNVSFLKGKITHAFK